MFRMMRHIISEFYGSDATLKLYTPYIQVSILPQKETITGKHDVKVCLSVGREFDEEKARKFIESDDPNKDKILNAFSKEVGVSVSKILENAKKEGALKKVVVDWLEKKIKQFNIPITVIRSDKGFQVYEMFKTNDFTEIMQVFWRVAMMVGAGLRLFANNEYTLDEIEELIKKNVGRWLKLGYEKAGEFKSKELRLIE